MVSPALPVPSSRATPRVARRVSAGVMSRADALCWAVVAMGFVYVWRIQILVPDLLVPLRLGIVTTAIALLAWYNVNDPLRRWNLLQQLTPIRLLIGLCVVIIAGIPLGIYPGRSVTFFRVTYSGIAVYLLLTLASIRSRADVRRLMLMHVIGATIFCLFVLRFTVGSSGRLTNLPSYDPNDFAMLLVCSIPLAVYFMQARSKLLARLLVGLALILFVVILVRTGSRGGFLGFIAALVYLLFRFKGIPVRIRVAAITVGLVTLSLAGTDKYWELMGTLKNPEEDYNFTKAGGRWQIWQRGVGYLAQHPVTGGGLNNFGAAEGWSDMNRARTKEGKGWIAAAPHNSFLQAATELGILGFGFFIALLFVSLRACSSRAPPRATPEEKDEQAMARALAGALVGYVVAGFFLSQAYSAYLYSLLGLAAGLIKLRHVSKASVTGGSSRSLTAPVSRGRSPRVARRGA
jgi:O-antigen ligase